MARVLISKAQADLTDYGLNIPPGMDAGALQNVRRTLKLLNSHPNALQRNKNQTNQSDLSDFGVPQQEVAVRQPMPSAEDIERVVRESNVALTPREFANKVPLVERKTRGSEERGGEVGTAFGRQMGLEGSLAHGLAASEYPQIKDFEDPLAVPFIRDYYSRQTTLPEHFWDYHTEGPYYDEEGNILPGQVPPVNAVKVMGSKDIASMGTREGYGLKPVPLSAVNMEWDEKIPLKYRFPSANIGFVGNLSEEDISLNAAGNVGGRDTKGAIGVRGFGRPQDKAFARGRFREGIEGGFTAPIPPERLVGVMPATRMSKDELEENALRDLYTKDIPFEQKLQQMVSDGEVSAMDAIHALIRHKTESNRMKTRYGMATDAARADAIGEPYYDYYYPMDLNNLIGSDAGRHLRYSKVSDLGNRYSYHEYSPGMAAIERVNDAYRDALPLSWQEGVFGLENPLLTEEEKRQYLQDIKTAATYKDEEELERMQPSELRGLYPKQAGVRFQ